MLQPATLPALFPDGNGLASADVSMLQFQGTNVFDHLSPGNWHHENCISYILGLKSCMFDCPLHCELPWPELLATTLTVPVDSDANNSQTCADYCKMPAIKEFQTDALIEQEKNIADLISTHSFDVSDSQHDSSASLYTVNGELIPSACSLVTDMESLAFSSLLQISGLEEENIPIATAIGLLEEKNTWSSSLPDATELSMTKEVYAPISQAHVEIMKKQNENKFIKESSANCSLFQISSSADETIPIATVLTVPEKQSVWKSSLSAGPASHMEKVLYSAIPQPQIGIMAKQSKHKPIMSSPLKKIFLPHDLNETQPMKHFVPTSCFSALVSPSFIAFTDILMLTPDKCLSVLDEALNLIQSMKRMKY